MSTDQVSQYINLINKQLKPHTDEEEDSLVNQLDVLWYAMSDSEKTKAETACKVLRNYREGRK